MLTHEGKLKSIQFNSINSLNNLEINKDMPGNDYSVEYLSKT